MDFKVEIDAEQVNQVVADAILHSAIGDQIQSAVDEVTKEYSKSWDNPIRKVVTTLVQQQIREVVTEQFLPLIKQKVSEYLTDEIAADIIDKSWKALQNRGWN